MKTNLFFLSVFTLILLSGCNPFPKDDPYPEVPLLADLLKDQTKFKKVADMENLSEIIFLKDNRILLKPNDSKHPFKIIDNKNNVILAEKYDWDLPFYIDQQGDLYFNRKKYFYPNYKKQEEFKTIVFQDSLSQKSEELKNLNDTLRIKAIQEYEVNLLIVFGLAPCEYDIVYTERCDIFEVRNQTLIVRQAEHFKIDFLKSRKKIPKFNEDVLIGWNNGKMANPVYLAYHQINNIKFKCDDMTYPTIVNIAGKDHLYDANLGLYQIL